jgi:hypothetical protein
VLPSGVSVISKLQQRGGLGPSRAVELERKIFHGFEWLSIASRDEFSFYCGGERSGPTTTGQTRKVRCT